MAKPKIEIPADLTAPFPIPEGASAADLAAIRAELAGQAQKLLAKDDASAHDVEVAEWMGGAIDAVDAQSGVLATEAAERKAKMDELRGRIGDQGTEGGTDEAPELTDDDKPEGGEGGAIQTGADGVEGGAPAEPVLVASAATARKRSAIGAAIAGNGGKVEQPQNVEARSATLLASADVPGFRAGQTLDWANFGVASEKRFRQLPSGSNGNGGRVQLPFGNVQLASDPELVASKVAKGDIYEIEDQIAWALSNERLKRETGADSLLAAGGWCAPSETLYDLINLTTTDGLIDLPGITVNRGGVRYSLGPDFTAVYTNGANFTRTEAQTIAGVTKPVVNVPCPTFNDHRMVVDGLYLTGDILSQKGYPEAYADYLQKSLTAFAHYVSAQTIADMVALAGTAIDLTQPGSSPTYYQNGAITTELLGAIELAVIDMQYKNRLSLTNSVEVVLPIWLKGALRSDLAKRQGVDNAANISDADIAGYFALRGANVQWVYDWQDSFTGVSGGFGGATAQKAWPASANFLIYPQGAFVRALSDVIELNAVYDSTLLTTNQFVFLFMEQARLTLQRAWDVRQYKVPVNVTGAVGAPVAYYTGTPGQPTV